MKTMQERIKATGVTDIATISYAIGVRYNTILRLVRDGHEPISTVDQTLIAIWLKKKEDKK